MKTNTRYREMADFLLAYQWELWAFVSLVFLVLELTAGDFFMLCLAIGAMGAAVAAAIGGGFLACLAVFAVVSVACLYFVRPKALRRFGGGKAVRKSNADALDGSTGVVREEIPAGGYGYVAIDGDMWRSVSLDGKAIPAGTRVTVVSHKSIILTVRPQD